ncbi:MAG: hypothetical protein EAZ42_12830 [Verrucomicrobia bacterium]|nr:MAG: hypothetical protein EAZ42_12830 [Verrucomicrobiota bacterium]
MSPDSQQDFSFAFLSILMEGIPFILLGTLISGFIDVYLPAGTIDRLLPRNRVLSVWVAGLLGAILPVCECAVVPVIRRLVSKGLPVSCALTYMLAAPIVNPITALSTWKAFLGQEPEVMTLSRILLGYLVAVGVGWVALAFSNKKIIKARLLEQITEQKMRESFIQPAQQQVVCPPPQPGDRLVAAFRSAVKDFVEVGVYFTIGVAITALFNTGIAPGAAWLDGLATNQTIAPAALMVLAFILSLCSTSDAFIAATLDKFTWAAKLAFLTFGPMMDMKLIFLYQTVLRRSFILWMAIGIFLTIWLCSMVLQSFVFSSP